MGEITNCCQSIGSAGANCALSSWSYDHPDKGVVVVEKDDEIVAQSWMWIDNSRRIVFDSIELKGLDWKRLQKVSEALLEFMLALKNTFMVDECYVGATDYGVTKEIRKALPCGKKGVYAQIVNYDGYMDGEEQYRVEV